MQYFGMTLNLTTVKPISENNLHVMGVKYRAPARHVMNLTWTKLL